MRIRRYILPALILIGLMSWSFTIVCKAISNPDFGRKGSITVVMMDEETNRPVPDGEVCLYYVAEMQKTGLEYCYTDEFALCDFSLKDIEDDTLPKKLVEYAEKKEMDGEIKIVDRNGKVVFEELPLGMYLGVQTKAAEGYYKINPFLITVPISDKEKWTYDVYSYPKMELLPTKGYSPAGSASAQRPSIWIEPLIPKTGQLWWPVPVLAFTGSVCILIGFMLGKRDKKNAK